MLQQTRPAMSSGRIAAMIGAVFGLVFVLVNAGAAGAPWGLLLRVLGVVLFVAVVVRLVRAPDVPVRPRGSALRVYWACVAAEVLAIVVGTRLLAGQGLGEYGVAWVAAVVGLHFLPFARAFRLPSFRWLGLGLVALGALGALAGALGGGETAVALVSGVGSGLLLTGWAAVPMGGARTGVTPQ